MSQKHYKAVVIGSGAGGAPAAARLAAKWGDGVAILEAGAYLHLTDFSQREKEMIPKLYVEGGAQATVDGSLSVLQGHCVGGSTVINDALCFRPPDEIAGRWRAYGVELDMATLARYADEVEARMGVMQMGQHQINRANYLVGLGAARLGWKGERLRHNSPGCIQCGFRHTGCAYGVKLSMDLSWIPGALASGAQLHTTTRVHHLQKISSGWKIITNKGAFAADTVVLTAGIVQTPTILLRSGFEAGQGLQFHVQTVAWGDFAEPVDGFNGIPMSYGVLEFADVYGHKGPGYVIEGVAVQPLAFSVQPQLGGAAWEEVLRRYRYLSGALMLLRSSSRGTLTLKNDQPVLDYPLNRHDRERTRHFYEKIVELYLAAGARRVLAAHRDSGWMTSPRSDFLVEAGRQYLYTAHPFGGACRGTTTNEIGQVRGTDNLWVLDASAFPEAPGVNPQITIASLALQGADHILNL